jgi:hypothetical protein
VSARRITWHKAGLGASWSLSATCSDLDPPRSRWAESEQRSRIQATSCWHSAASKRTSDSQASSGSTSAFDKSDTCSYAGPRRIWPRSNRQRNCRIASAARQRWLAHGAPLNSTLSSTHRFSSARRSRLGTATLSPGRSSTAMPRPLAGSVSSSANRQKSLRSRPTTAG